MRLLIGGIIITIARSLLLDCFSITLDHVFKFMALIGFSIIFIFARDKEV